MSLLHENFSAEILALAEHNGETQKKITDQPKFVSASAECRQIIRQEREGNIRISASLCCTIVFVGSLLLCADCSADVNSGTAF